VLPVTAGIRDGVVQLVSILGGVVSSARAWARSHHVGGVLTATGSGGGGQGGGRQLPGFCRDVRLDAAQQAEACAISAKRVDAVMEVLDLLHVEQCAPNVAMQKSAKRNVGWVCGWEMGSRRSVLFYAARCSATT
jgi:hypothetical protein